MTKLKMFEKGWNGDIEEQFNDWTKENPAVEVLHIAAGESSSQHGSREKTLYVVYKENEEVSL